MSETSSRPTVLIYRKRLLYWSETFIAAQAGALERYRPVFAGLRHKQEGRAYMGDAASVTLEDNAYLYLKGGGDPGSVDVTGEGERTAGHAPTTTGTARSVSADSSRASRTRAWATDSLASSSGGSSPRTARAKFSTWSA